MQLMILCCWSISHILHFYFVNCFFFLKIHFLNYFWKNRFYHLIFYSIHSCKKKKKKKKPKMAKMSHTGLFTFWGRMITLYPFGQSVPLNYHVKSCLSSQNTHLMLINAHPYKNMSTLYPNVQWIPLNYHVLAPMSSPVYLPKIPTWC